MAQFSSIEFESKYLFQKALLYSVNLVFLADVAATAKLGVSVEQHYHYSLIRSV